MGGKKSRFLKNLHLFSQNTYLTRLEEIRDTLELSPFFKTHEVKDTPRPPVEPVDWNWNCAYNRKIWHGGF